MDRTSLNRASPVLPEGHLEVASNVWNRACAGDSNPDNKNTNNTILTKDLQRANFPNLTEESDSYTREKTYSAYSPRALWNFVMRQPAKIKRVFRNPEHQDAPSSSSSRIGRNCGGARYVRDQLAKEFFPDEGAMVDRSTIYSTIDHNGEQESKRTAFTEKFNFHFASSVNANIGAPLRKGAVIKFLNQYQTEAKISKARKDFLESYEGQPEQKKVAEKFFNQAFAPKYFGPFCYSRPAFDEKKLAEVKERIATNACGLRN